MSEHPSVAIIKDLEARNAELVERVRVIGITKWVHDFDSIICALEERKLSLSDLTRAVSIERIRAALTPPSHHA
jgi:hypothetical protein